jgi:NADH/NAD ratio-sensing transcriptional regulator Rex
MMICFLWLPRIYLCQKQNWILLGISKLEDVPRVTKLGKKLLNLDVHKELKVSNAEFFDLEEDMVEQND